jgi:Domain of unknown function (DUF6438)
MTAMRVRLATIVCLLFATVARSQEGITNSAIIRIEKTGCFGACPVYSAAIYQDGKVEYRGSRFVRVKGTCVSHVSANELRSILRVVSSEKFRSLHSSDSQPGTDAPSTTLIVETGGLMKVITDYTGEQPVVAEAADVIELNTSIYRWIGGPNLKKRLNDHPRTSCDIADFDL